MNKSTRFNLICLGYVAFEAEQRSQLGPVGDSFRPRSYSEDTAREIDCAVRKIVATAFERARSILEENRSLLEDSARLLLQEETLDEHDLRQIFKAVKPAPDDFQSAEPPCGDQATIDIGDGR